MGIGITLVTALLLQSQDVGEQPKPVGEAEAQESQPLPPEFAGRILAPGDVSDNFTTSLRGQTPEFGVRRTVAVGDTMFTAFSYTVSVAARFPAEFSIGGGREDRHVVPTTEPLIIQDLYFPTIVACSTRETRTAPNGYRGYSCFVDQDRDGRFERVRRDAPIRGGSIDISPPAPYVFTPDRVDTINFRYELVYLGRAGSTLRIAYREFSNEMARPAFSNDLTFDIAPSGPTVFRYRDLRVTVYAINNEGISFQVERASN